MAEDEESINETKALLQDCLPGVTLHNSRAYYHQRQPSDLSSPHSQEIDQLQQQILISNAINKISNDDDNEHSTVISSSVDSRRDPTITGMDDSSRIDILWIDKNSNIDSYRDGNADEFDDIVSYSFSIRKAAALSEARRRTDERYFLYMKWILVVFLCFFMSDEYLSRRTKHTNTDIHSNESYRGEFRFNRHWRKKVTSMHVYQRDGRDDNEEQKILVVLKDLDESIHGDIVLRSNKTNFLDAARVWQRRDWVLHEESSLPSSVEPRLPPLAIVEAASVDDVKFAVPILGGLARDYQLEFRIKSGGYAYMSGYSTVSDGVVLSLANFNTIRINDQQSHGVDDDLNATKTFKGINDNSTTRVTRSTTVVIGPGVRTEDFMKEVLDGNGYGGVVASAAGVGMGGFILGGGYGLQSRMYGLAIDNVVGLEVVLSSGEIKEVKEDDDLFWALCGAGGGNIGVVSSIEYQVYPSHDIKLAGE